MGILHSIGRLLGCKTEYEEDRQWPFYHQKQNLKPYLVGHTFRSSDKRILKISNFPSLIFKAIKGLLQKVRFIFFFPRPSTRADPVLPAPNPAPTLSVSDYDASLVQPLIISDSSSEIASLAGSENNVDALSWENNSTNREEMDRAIISMPDFADGEYNVAAVSWENNVDALSWGSNSTSREEMDRVIISIPDFADSENDIDALSCGSDSTNGEEMDCAIISIPDFADSENNVEGIKWIKHYSSHHHILLVGEGDFSFSACLAVAFDWASNIMATSLDSEGVDAFHY